MRIGRTANRVGWALALLAIAASSTRASAAESDFGRFLATAKRQCADAPAPACIDRLWPLADRNRDGVLDLREVQALDKNARTWAQTVDRSHRDPERDGTLFVLAILQQVGLPKVFDSFDGDRDGVITKNELFADFKFDKRPFRELVTDPEAVNWRSLGHRFGPIGALLASFLSQPPPRREAPRQR